MSGVAIAIGRSASSGGRSHRPRRRRRALTVVAVLLALLLVSDEALARRGGGFGGFGGRSFSRGFSTSRSFSSRGLSRSRSWGSTTRSRSFGGSSTARRSLSGTRASTASANTRNVSQGQYQRARANGTTFQTRSQAESAFRNRFSSQYPSRYSSQPGTRPTHIPNTTSVDGRNVNVAYNAGRGGYGYIHPTLGTWVLYSAVADAAMLGVLMGNRGYYYGPAPGAYYGGRSSSFWTGMMILAIIVAIYFVMRSGQRRY